MKQNKTKRKKRNKTKKRKHQSNRKKIKRNISDNFINHSVDMKQRNDSSLMTTIITIIGASLLGYFIKSFFKYSSNMKNDKFKECLSDMKNILDKNGQEFFLVCGTLLGQKRENNFISHDTDIDIGIFRSALNTNIKNIISKSPNFTFYRLLGKLNESYELTFKHTNGTLIDIFIYYPVENKKDYYYIASFGGICESKKVGYCKWGNHIRGLKSVTFMNNNYLVPKNTEEYLIESYGKDWRIPKKFSYLQGIRDKTCYANMIN